MTTHIKILKTHSTCKNFYRFAISPTFYHMSNVTLMIQLMAVTISDLKNTAGFLFLFL